MEFMDLLYPHEIIPHPAIASENLNTLIFLWRSHCWRAQMSARFTNSWCLNMFFHQHPRWQAIASFMLVVALGENWVAYARASTCLESRGHVVIRTPNKIKWYLLICDIWYLICFIYLRTIRKNYNQWYVPVMMWFSCHCVKYTVEAPFSGKGQGFREFCDGLTSKTTGLLESSPCSFAHIWIHEVFVILCCE